MQFKIVSLIALLPFAIAPSMALGPASPPAFFEVTGRSANGIVAEKCSRDPANLFPAMADDKPLLLSAESRAQRSGTTVLIVTADANGRIDNIAIEKSGGWDAADAEVLKRVKDQWRPQPSINGCVAARLTVPWHN